MEYTKVYYGRSREKVKIKADDGGSLAHALIVLSSTPISLASLCLYHNALPTLVFPTPTRIPKR